jgi:hypothetical protein
VPVERALLSSMRKKQREPFFSVWMSLCLNLNYRMVKKDRWENQHALFRREFLFILYQVGFFGFCFFGEVIDYLHQVFGEV